MLLIRRKAIVTLVAIVAITKTFSVGLNLKEEVRSLFLDSIIQVESSGRDNAIARDGSAGPLQIKPVLVKDINRRLRIIGDTTRFTMSDRFSREKAIEMFWAYQRLYGSENDSFEKMARRWNGGPRGPKKKRTEAYWKKVNRTLVGLMRSRGIKTNA